MPSVKVSGELLKLLKGWQKKRELASVEETVEWIALVGDNRQRALDKHAKGNKKPKAKKAGKKGRKKAVSKTRKTAKAKPKAAKKNKISRKPKAAPVATPAQEAPAAASA